MLIATRQGETSQSPPLQFSFSPCDSAMRLSGAATLLATLVTRSLPLALDCSFALGDFAVAALVYFGPSTFAICSLSTFSVHPCKLSTPIGSSPLLCFYLQLAKPCEALASMQLRTSPVTASNALAKLLLNAKGEVSPAPREPTARSRPT